MTSPDLPEGTVSFLFTDIEGSTQLLDRLRDQYATLLADHRRILRDAFTKWNGSEIDTQGDAFFVAFPRATEAVSAVVDIQRTLATHTWPQDVEVRVRMGLHTGEPLTVEEGYVGMVVHRAARIAHVGHGGQVLLSETTTALVMDELPEGVELLDLGRHLLKDMHRPEHIRQLVIEGLPVEFPPLKSLEMLPPAISLDVGEIKLPAFLENEVEETPAPVFVGRERELARLEGYLDQARAGRGGIVFITGGPGRGKTALLQAFAKRGMESYPDLIVTSGKCNAYTGVGDPYLPFREVLSDLTGDVQAKWAAGAISPDYAKRLWKVLPETTQALVDHSPDLVEVFISGKGLVSRASLAVPEQRGLLQAIKALAERDRALPGDMEQRALFEQYLNLLCELASRRPLLILLDDLQWADTASLNLLFQLGRELTGGRILVVGAYRPEEVDLGRGGERHPLEEILAELKRLYGDVWIDLSLTQEEEERRFVEAFLDSEPNQLGDVFREALSDHTGGHPLFTVELLREMQERGNLVRDEAGYWIEGEALNWNLLPARVDGVIEARIGRLEDELRDILTVASVEGEDFTAQVIARVKEASERGLVRQLSGDLDKVHRLVTERGKLQISGQRLYLYRFQHHLFQKFLYNGLGENEREMLHGDVGEVLEELYGDQSGEVAAQLAWHFSEAGEVDKAIHYLLLAGDRARVVYAYQEAVEFYQRAIVFLKDCGDYELAARTLMKLGMTYHSIFEFRRSQQAYDEAFVLRKRAYPTQSAILEPAPHPFKLVFIEPPTLDPTFVIDVKSRFYIESIFCGLVKLGTELEITPDVALSWEISEDGCRYVFHLRDDVQWSDGTQVTAEDFVYAWKRTLNPTTDARQEVAALQYDIKGARAYHMGEASDPDQVGVKSIDAFTLEVKLERPASYFLHLLTILYPVPQHVVEAHGEAWTEPGNLVTNGPFLLESYQPSESIILARNPAYHGRFPGNLQGVEVKLNLPILSSGELEIYELDRVDMANLDEATYPERYRYAEEYISGPEPGVIYVAFDTSRSPFDDSRVRRAFVMAVDREKLADEVLGGYYYPATGGLVPPVLLGHSAGIALPYDPDQARQLLAQAGYPEGRAFPSLELVYYRVPNILEYLKAQWSHNLNVEVAIEIRDWASVLNELLGRNLLMMGWTPDYPDPDSFLRVCVRAHVPYWRNETYSRLLEGARRTSNQGDRIALYQAADKILIEDAVIMPITYFRAHRLVKPWVNLPGGGLDFRNLKAVIIEPH